MLEGQFVYFCIKDIPILISMKGVCMAFSSYLLMHGLNSGRLKIVSRSHLLRPKKPNRPGAALRGAPIGIGSGLKRRNSGGGGCK